MISGVFKVAFESKQLRHNTKNSVLKKKKPALVTNLIYKLSFHKYFECQSISMKSSGSMKKNKEQTCKSENNDSIYISG